MIRRFKFLTDNDDEDDITMPVYDMEFGFASWMWANGQYSDPHWVPDQMTTTSIRAFLSNFPEQVIVPIISITGDNITMTIENEHDPWPFNILGGTELHIVYFRWQPE